MAAAIPLRLLSIGHSYVVALNRRLVHELAVQGARQWQVVALAPRTFQGDLRPIVLERESDSTEYELRSAKVRFSRSAHLFWYDATLNDLLRQPWDVVHVWEEPYVLASVQVARSIHRDTKLVISTFQNIRKPYPPPFSNFEGMVLTRADGVVAFGHTGLDVLQGRSELSGKPIRVIPVGVDVDAFRPSSTARAAVLSQFGWNHQGAPVVGFLGRFIVEKGLRVLCAALDQIRSPWRALFVGGGPLEAELRRWADAWPGRVKILTTVRHSEVPEHLNAMDILCAPSLTTERWREQFGRMLIEAFAAGVAVVGSNSGEIPFTVGKAGHIVAEGDVNAWATAISLLLVDKDLRAELGARGRERALDKFSWVSIAQHHLKFFEEILEASTDL